MAGYVSEAVIRRLPSYYRHLRELEEEGVTQISSHDLGARMQLTPSQVRQDINSFGGFGRQGYGYPVKGLREHMRALMGLNETRRTIIIGAGRIGRAIANYEGFRREGFCAAGLFDNDPGLIGKQEGDLPIYDVSELEERIAEITPSIAVLAVPAGAAQEILERVYALGIRAVWNFAPVDLKYPRDMTVVNVHLVDSLLTLGFRMMDPDGY